MFSTFEEAIKTIDTYEFGVGINIDLSNLHLSLGEIKELVDKINDRFKRARINPHMAVASLYLNGQGYGDDVAQLLATCQLNHLSVNQNNFSSAGAKALVNSSLISLEIKDNPIGEEGAAALFANKKLAVIDASKFGQRLEDPLLAIYLDKNRRIKNREEYINLIKPALPWLKEVNIENLPDVLRKKVDAVFEANYQLYVYFCDQIDAGKIKVIFNTGSESLSESYEGEISVGFDESMGNRKYVHLGKRDMEFNRLFQYYRKLDNLTVAQVNDFGCWYMINEASAKDFAKFLISTPQLNVCIANTITEYALNLIQKKADVNQYSLEFGSNPLLLALSKGWNHHNSAGFDDDDQKPIIEQLLSSPDIDVNCIHLTNGLTPLHIACLRGDDPQLIKKLLVMGADLNAVDYSGRTPAMLLEESYENAKNIIKEMTGGYEFSSGTNDNISCTTTIQTREDRIKNIAEIQNMLKHYVNNKSASSSPFWKKPASQENESEKPTIPTVRPPSPS